MKYHDLYSENQQLTSTNRDYQANLSGYEVEKEKYNETMGKIKDMESLVEVNSQLQSKNDDLEDMCQRVTEECQKNSQIKDSLVKERKKLNDSLFKIKKLNGELDYNLAEKDSQIQGLTAELEKIISKNNDLSQRFSNLEQENVNTNEVLTTRLQIVERDYDAANNEKNSLLSKVTKKGNKVKFLQKAILQKNDEIDSLTNELKLIEDGTKHSSKNMKRIQEAYHSKLKKIETDLIDEKIYSDSLQS